MEKLPGSWVSSTENTTKAKTEQAESPSSSKKEVDIGIGRRSFSSEQQETSRMKKFFSIFYKKKPEKTSSNPEKIGSKENAIDLLKEAASTLGRFSHDYQIRKVTDEIIEGSQFLESGDFYNFQTTIDMIDGILGRGSLDGQTRVYINKLREAVIFADKQQPEGRSIKND